MQFLLRNEFVGHWRRSPIRLEISCKRSEDMRGMHSTANAIGDSLRRFDDFSIEHARLVICVERVERRQNDRAAPRCFALHDQKRYRAVPNEFKVGLSEQ